jgi:cytochrome c5
LNQGLNDVFSPAFNPFAMKKLSIVAVALVFAACSSQLATPTQADADRGAAMHQGLTLAQLQEGKKLYAAECNRCHPLKDPAKWTAAEWSEIMPKMIKGVEKKGGMLTDEQKDNLLRYAQTMAKKGA